MDAINDMKNWWAGPLNKGDLIMAAAAIVLLIFIVIGGGWAMIMSSVSSHTFDGGQYAVGDVNGKVAGIPPYTGGYFANNQPGSVGTAGFSSHRNFGKAIGQNALLNAALSG